MFNALALFVFIFSDVSIVNVVTTPVELVINSSAVVSETDYTSNVESINENLRVNPRCINILLKCIGLSIALNSKYNWSCSGVSFRKDLFKVWERVEIIDVVVADLGFLEDFFPPIIDVNQTHNVILLAELGLLDQPLEVQKEAIRLSMLSPEEVQALALENLARRAAERAEMENAAAIIQMDIRVVD